MKECYYVGVEGTDVNLVRSGLFWLFENASEKGGWLSIMTLDALQSYIDHHKLEVLRALLKDGHIAVINGKEITLITKEWIPSDGCNKPMLAIHPKTDFLDKIDEIPNITKMAVVPFIASEVENWRKKHEANELELASLGATPTDFYLDQTIVAGLEDLVNTVNLFQSVWENDVKFASINLFTILCQNGFRDYAPEGIKQWLISRGGWNPIAASQAATIADEVRSGNTYDLFTDRKFIFWENEAIKKWRNKYRTNIKSK